MIVMSEQKEVNGVVCIPLPGFTSGRNHVLSTTYTSNKYATKNKCFNIYVIVPAVTMDTPTQAGRPNETVTLEATVTNEVNRKVTNGTLTFYYDSTQDVPNFPSELLGAEIGHVNVNSNGKGSVNVQIPVGLRGGGVRIRVRYTNSTEGYADKSQATSLYVIRNGSYNIQLYDSHNVLVTDNSVTNGERYLVIATLYDDSDTGKQPLSNVKTSVILSGSSNPATGGLTLIDETRTNSNGQVSTYFDIDFSGMNPFYLHTVCEPKPYLNGYPSSAPRASSSAYTINSTSNIVNINVDTTNLASTGKATVTFDIEDENGNEITTGTTQVTIQGNTVTAHYDSNTGKWTAEVPLNSLHHSGYTSATFDVTISGGGTSTTAQSSETSTQTYTFPTTTIKEIPSETYIVDENAIQSGKIHARFRLEDTNGNVLQLATTTSGGVSHPSAFLIIDGQIVQDVWATYVANGDYYEFEYNLPTSYYGSSHTIEIQAMPKFGNTVTVTETVQVPLHVLDTRNFTVDSTPFQLEGTPKFKYTTKIVDTATMQEVTEGRLYTKLNGTVLRDTGTQIHYGTYENGLWTFEYDFPQALNANEYTCVLLFAPQSGSGLANYTKTFTYTVPRREYKIEIVDESKYNTDGITYKVNIKDDILNQNINREPAVTVKYRGSNITSQLTTDYHNPESNSSIIPDEGYFEFTYNPSTPLSPGFHTIEINVPKGFLYNEQRVSKVTQLISSENNCMMNNLTVDDELLENHVILGTFELMQSNIANSHLQNVNVNNFITKLNGVTLGNNDGYILDVQESSTPNVYDYLIQLPNGVSAGEKTYTLVYSDTTNNLRAEASIPVTIPKDDVEIEVTNQGHDQFSYFANINLYSVIHSSPQSKELVQGNTALTIKRVNTVDDVDGETVYTRDSTNDPVVDGAAGVVTITTEYGTSDLIFRIIAGENNRYNSATKVITYHRS